MGAHSGPNISDDELIFAIDAGNTRCFTDGQTTCNNLITNGLLTGANGTPGSGTHSPNTANFPSYSSMNGGVFDFAGGRGMNCEENLGSHTALTMSMWIYKTGGREYFTDARNDGGQWFLSNYSGENINYTDKLRYNFDGSYNASATEFIGKWLNMTVASDGSGSKLYLNGYEISNNPYGYRNVYVSSTSINKNLGKNFRIGTRYTTSNQWGGLMGPMNIYKRKLSDFEIYDLYASSRTRFGV